MQSTTMTIPPNLANVLEVYRQEMDTIRRGYDLLELAWNRLQAAAGKDTYGSRLCPVPGSPYIRDGLAVDQTHDAELRIRQALWKLVIDKINPWPYLTERRERELNEWLQNEHTLPPFNEEEILKIFAAWASNRHEFIQQLAVEVHQTLVPRWDNHRKTNIRNRKGYRIGKKVIVTNVISHKFGGGCEVGYYAGRTVDNIDSLFHLLDGTTMPLTYHHGPLVTAIEGIEPGEKGETDYFIFKAYPGAGTLHLTFKRQDLVEQLEQLAAEKVLAQNV